MPSPYHVSDQNRESYMTDTGIKTFTLRNGRRVMCHLDDNMPYYVYNPSTVQANVDQHRVLDYVLVSNFEVPLKIPSVESRDFVHKPWYYVDLPPWVDIDGKMWRAKDGFVWDVKEPGTLVSKRARVPPPPGHKWKPPDDWGRYAWDRYTIWPKEQPSANMQTFVNSQQQIVNYELLDVNVKVIPLPVEIHVKRVIHDVDSECNLFVDYLWTVEGQPVEVVSDDEPGEIAYMMYDGSVLEKKMLTRQVKLFRIDKHGDLPITGLPRGYLSKALSFYYLDYWYIFHEPKRKRGNYSVFLPNTPLSGYIVRVLNSHLKWEQMKKKAFDNDFVAAKPVSAIEMVAKEMSLRPLSNINGYGITITEMVRRLPMKSPNVIASIMNRMERMLIWRNAITEGMVQYAYIPALLFRIFGDGSRPGTVNGRVLAELFEEPRPVWTISSVGRIFTTEERHFVQRLISILRDSNRLMRFETGTYGDSQAYLVFVKSMI